MSLSVNDSSDTKKWKHQNITPHFTHFTSLDKTTL
jgi:hypothetical protein